VTPVIVPKLLDRPDIVWDNFACQIGEELLRACYGWTVPPRVARPGETVWSYRAGRNQESLIGWGSLIKDPTTPLYWYAAGVFPAFARRGYRQAIRQHLCTTAFAWGAEAVSLVVLGTNPEHLWRCHREAVAGSPWKWSGNSWRPTPFSVFTLLRQDATHLADDPRTCAYASEVR